VSNSRGGRNRRKRRWQRWKRPLEELKEKYLVLEIEKASVKVELEQTQVDTLHMLGETFEKAI